MPPNLLPASLVIYLGTDGAKVDKGDFQFWPHQIRIFNILKIKHFIVGIYKGKQKPHDIFAFYEQLIQEITTILEDVGITIRCFIADAAGIKHQHQLRTDAEYHNLLDDDHHQGRSGNL